MGKNILTEIDKSDIAKINSEILQLLNQRFNITMYALTTFLAAIAWVWPKDNGPNMIKIYSAAILLNIVLLILFIYLCVLRTKMRILTEYLHINGFSNWEYCYQTLKRKIPYLKHYTHPQYLMFMLLVLVTTVAPVIIELFNHPENKADLIMLRVPVIIELFSHPENKTDLIILRVTSIMSGAALALTFSLVAFGRLIKSTLNAREYWRVLFNCPRGNSICMFDDLKETETIRRCTGLREDRTDFSTCKIDKLK